MTLTQIQAFEPIFNELNFTNPKAAATYYVILIEESPTNFEYIKEKAKYFIKKDITSNKLRQGRAELLERGFIAQALDPSLAREAYWPVSPLVILEENQKLIHSLIDIDQLVAREKDIRKLDIIYNEIFNLKEGYPIEGKIENKNYFSIRYSSSWLFRIIISNIKNELLLMLNDLESFSPPNGEYYHTLLKNKITIKIIFQESPQIRHFTRDYGGKLELKHASISHGTSRMALIDGCIAIDSKKIYYNGSHSYIGTLYNGEMQIKYLYNQFISEWDRATDL